MRVTNLVVAGAIASAVAMASTPATLADGSKEKCYGVAHAGKNDCASAGNNSCAGQSKADFEGGAWKYVEKGTCTQMKVTMPDGKSRMGSLEPIKS